MKILYSFSSLDTLPYIASIGIFDGVHRGHQKIFSRMKELSSLHSQPTLLITFSTPPSTLLYPSPKKWINSLEHKLYLFQTYGIDQVLLLPFTPTLSKKTAEAFIEPIPLSHLIIGESASIGHKREGSAHLLPLIGKKKGFIVESLPLEKEIYAISSTRIRSAISSRDFFEVEKLLGRPYSLYFPQTSHGPISEKRLMVPPSGRYLVQLQTTKEVIPSLLSISSKKKEKYFHFFPSVKKPFFCLFSSTSFQR